MFSLEQIRKIDPALDDIPDDQLLKIRDDLYGLAELGLEDYFREKKLGKTGLVKDK